MGFIIETPTKEGAHLMTQMKSLAPPDTHPLHAISCPQFSRYQLVLYMVCSQAQAWLREVNAPVMQESPALQNLTSKTTTQFNQQLLFQRFHRMLLLCSECRSLIVPSALKETCCIIIQRRQHALVNAALPLVS